MIVNGMLLGTCVAAMVAILGAVFTGGLTEPYAIFALAVGALFPLRELVMTWRTRRLRPEVGLGFWDILAVVAFALFALRAFLWVVYTTGDDVKVGNVNNLGDLPLHWQYTLFLAQGAPFWPDNPIAAQGTIGYPFGVDLLNSLAVLAGLDIVRSFVWVGLIGAALTGAMLFRWGRAFVLAGFLFNGGMSGFGELREWTLHAGQNVDWKSIPLALFVTQRGFLYAFPVGLLLLDSWRTRIREAHGEPSRRRPLALWAEVLLYATMPVFHLHTFLFLSAMLGWWFVFGGEKVRMHTLRVVAAALIPATLLVLWLTDFFASGGGAFRFQPGWMQKNEPFLQYWFLNFGLFIPLALALGAALAIPRKRWAILPPGELAVARLFVAPALLVFLACCLFTFAYWEWDNTKLMAWSYLVLLPFLWDALLRPCALWLRVPIVTLLFFSGFLSLLGGLSPDDNGYSIATRSEIDAVANVIDPIPIEARFATAPDYNHPLVFLGRKLTMGYPGHFVGHGLDLDSVQADLDTLMRGKGDWRAAAERLEADYIFWGIRERAAFPDSTRPWVSDSVQVAGGPWGELYLLPPREDAESESATPPE